MCRVRCSICRQQLPTLKLLISHYLNSHSKLKVVKELLRNSILRSSPHLIKRTHKYKQKSFPKKHPRQTKDPTTKTLYLNEDIHILCSQNEIIIGDSKSDLEFSFEETSCESKENRYIPLKDNNGNNIPRKRPNLEDDVKIKVKPNERSPSASSEDSNDTLEVVRRKIKRKKEFLEKRRHYRINITKLKDQQSLDDHTGEFYICHCRENYLNGRRSLQKSDIRIITSDTESCSDNGKTLLMPTLETKIYCYKCGSGYNNRAELNDHMQVHETFCRLCNESFSCEFSFREHMRLHIFKVYMCHVCGREFPFKELLQLHFECHMEDRTFESVLDMEEEYRIHRYNFMAMNYSSSINSILCFLSESHDIYYYSYKFMRVVCDICFHEVFFCDYEHHLQTVHYPYTY